MRRRFACWLFALLAPAAAATQPQVEVRRDGDAFVVEAQAQLQADRPTAWATLTDYEHLPQFVPGIRRVDVLARSGDAAAERLLLGQQGELRFFLYAVPVQVWLDVRHEAPARVLARLVRPSGIGPAPSTLRDFEGSYALAVVDGGRTRLTYRARIEPAQSLLPVLGTLAVRHTARQQFGALVAEIERRAAAGRALRAER
jgi:carbon monoxide dehydrogenase subunit G